MATFTVTHKQLLDNYAVLRLLTPTEIVVGQSVVVSGVGAPFDATFVVVDLPLYLYTGINGEGDLVFDGTQPIDNQVLFAVTGANVNRTASPGTITYTQTCTWISDADCDAWLGGIVASAADTAFVTTCVAAANAFVYRRRQEAGYFDASLAVAPSADVKLGTVMFAGALYRQRGSIDQFASFVQGSGGGITGLSPIIKQLLGVDRPAFA